MKRKKLLLTTLVAAAFVTGGVIYAADHIDTPAVTNQSTDITDLYVFKAQDPNNLVFVANTQGLTTPANSAALKFDENTVIEFNIDKTGDNVEDLVIQCKYDAATNKMQVYGPVVPSATGTKSKLEGAVTAEVAKLVGLATAARAMTIVGVTVSTSVLTTTLGTGTGAVGRLRNMARADNVGLAVGASVADATTVTGGLALSDATGGGC